MDGPDVSARREQHATLALILEQLGPASRVRVECLIPANFETMAVMSGAQVERVMVIADGGERMRCSFVRCIDSVEIEVVCLQVPTLRERTEWHDKGGW